MDTIDIIKADHQNHWHLSNIITDIMAVNKGAS